jgi:hypothetical protein
VGVVVGWQMDQAQIAAGAVDQGADRGLATPADDQVAFPVSDPQPDLYLQADPPQTI